MFDNRIGRSDSLKNEVSGYIQTLISTGKLMPGDRLPTERVMAEKFGVSRTVIRDAVKTLAGIGLLEVKHGRGIFVATVDGSMVGRQLSSLLSYSLETIEHIYEVRILLEKASAFWAAQRCNQEDYQRIRSLLQEARSVDPVDYGDKFAELNRNFHLCIAEASQNPVVAMMTENILNLLEDTTDETHVIPGRALLSIDEHEKVLTAIVDRKPDEAKIAMEGHLTSVLTTLRAKKSSSSKQKTPL